MNAVKPIETLYSGYRFRSRLEARWAVFFDALGIRYDYEPEGYELDGGERYLPDFWLTDLNMWVEIKPSEPTPREKRLAYLLSQGTGFNTVILWGTPKIPLFDYENQRVQTFYEALLFVATPPAQLTGFALSIHNHWLEMMPEFLTFRGYEPMQGDETRELFENWLDLDRQYYMNRYGIEHPKWEYGYTIKGLLWAFDFDTRLYKFDVSIDYGRRSDTADLRYAYEYAQTARFEHGETPKVKAWVNTDDIPF